MATEEACFDEIRSLIAALPGPDLEAGTAALAQTRAPGATRGGLGRIEEIVQWLATWQGKHPPQIRHPRVAIFVGSHGAAIHEAETRSAAAQVERLSAGEGAVSTFCRRTDADLRLYELAIDRPTRDFTKAPALDEAECARAISYGMMAVEPGIDALAVTAIGPGSRLAGEAICFALFGGTATDWARSETAGAVDAAVARHRPMLTDPFEILRHLGGLDLAAVIGAILAARMARVPVVIDGEAGLAAAAILHAVDRHGLDHCLAADFEPGEGPALLAERIGMRPLLDLRMAAGEGAAGALALSMLAAAADCAAESV